MRAVSKIFIKTISKSCNNILISSIADNDVNWYCNLDKLAIEYPFQISDYLNSRLLYYIFI